jgi:acetolactate synthase I/II/III large subunit
MGFQEYGLDLHNPDFVALAESYGARGHRMKQAGELAGILQHCVSTPAVHVVEVPVNYSVSHVLQVRGLKSLG